MKRFSRLFDPLAYLPRRPIAEHPKGAVIYSSTCEVFYLVIRGRIKITNLALAGSEVISRIVAPEEFFGECSLIDDSSAQRAVALEKVQIMGWHRAELEQQIERQPLLGVALMQHVILTNLEMEDRLVAMATCKTPQRIMLSLLQLARQLGEQHDAALRISSLTHTIIAEYTGTSREIVSTVMNRLRRMSLISYSRKYIEVNCEAVEESLRSDRIVGGHLMAQAVRPTLDRPMSA